MAPKDVKIRVSPNLLIYFDNVLQESNYSVLYWFLLEMKSNN